MANYNKVVLMGNITKTPEIKSVGDTSVCNITIAINRNFKSKDGEDKKQVTFVDVACWGKTAENVAKYLDKGSPILVDGELQSQNWIDKESGGKRSKLVVRANVVQFIGTKKSEPTADPESGEFE